MTWTKLTEDKATWPVDSRYCWIEFPNIGWFDEPVMSINYGDNLVFSELGTGGSLYGEETHGFRDVLAWTYATPPPFDGGKE